MPTKRKPAPQFEPHSVNATLATIIANQSSHAEEMRSYFDETKAELLVIKQQAFKTNGRVNMLEIWRETSKAKIAAIAATFGFIGSGVAWVLSVFDGK